MKASYGDKVKVSLIGQVVSPREGKALVLFEEYEHSFWVSYKDIKIIKGEKSNEKVA